MNIWHDYKAYWYYIFKLSSCNSASEHINRVHLSVSHRLVKVNGRCLISGVTDCVLWKYMTILLAEKADNKRPWIYCTNTNITWDFKSYFDYLLYRRGMSLTSSTCCLQKDRFSWYFDHEQLHQFSWQWWGSPGSE